MGRPTRNDGRPRPHAHASARLPEPWVATSPRRLGFSWNAFAPFRVLLPPPRTARWLRVLGASAPGVGNRALSKPETSAVDETCAKPPRRGCLPSRAQRTNTARCRTRASMGLVSLRWWFPCAKALGPESDALSGRSGAFAERSLADAAFAAAGSVTAMLAACRPQGPAVRGSRRGVRRAIVQLSARIPGPAPASSRCAA